MKSSLTNLGLAALAASLLAAPAFAATMTETFDTPPTGWTTDRYEPAGFNSPVMFGGDNRLEVTVSEDDGASGRPSNFSSTFYRTQGKQRDNPTGTINMSIDMFVDADMRADSNRVAGLWGIGKDASGANITSYPILELAGGEFQGWDGAAFVGFGDQGVGDDEWVTLGFEIDTLSDMMTYFVNGTDVGSFGANGTASLTQSIVQLINPGDDGINRSVYFDNLSTSDVSAVPVPAALPLMATGLIGLGFMARRKKKQA